MPSINNKKKEKAGRKIDGFWLKFWKMVSSVHGTIKWLLFLTLLLEGASFIGPYIFKLIIDSLTQSGLSNLRYVFLLVAALFVSEQAISFLNAFRDRKVFALILKLEVELLANAHHKMVFLDLGYHERENTGNKITKIQRGVDNIISLLSNLLWEVMPTIIQIIITTVILFSVDWRFALAVLALAPIFIYLTLKLSREVHEIREKRFNDYENVSGILGQSMMNINTVKSFAQEERENEKLRTVLGRINENHSWEFRKNINFNIGRNLIIDFGRIAVLFFGIYLIWRNSLTIGTLVFISTITERALGSLYRISRLYDSIMESREAVGRLIELEEIEPEVKNSKRGIVPKNLRGEIEFRDVSFSYGRKKNMALNGVNFRIAPGNVVALVGPSGGGKSTTARMIYRHYDPQKGKILFDGKDLKKYDIYSLRKFMAVVPQEAELFNASIRENIGYGKPEATFDEIRKAAEAANACEFIEKTEKGFDTMIGERGARLSGGQRQRIGIARAILTDPKILIFDEATSNLDYCSECLIQDAIEKLRKDRTIIIIAHRLTTIRKADKIIALEKGKVAEEGSHEELAKKEGGLYQELLRLQKMGEVA